MMVSVGKIQLLHKAFVSYCLLKTSRGSTPSDMTCKLYSFQANHHGSRVWLGFKKLRMEVGQQQNNATTTGCYEIRFGRFFRPTRCTAQCCSFGCCNEFRCEGTIDTVRLYRHFLYRYIPIADCRLFWIYVSRVSSFCLFDFLLGLVETIISACTWLIISGYSMGSCHGTFGPLVQLGRLRWLPIASCEGRWKPRECSIILTGAGY